MDVLVVRPRETVVARPSSARLPRVLLVACAGIALLAGCGPAAGSTPAGELETLLLDRHNAESSVDRMDEIACDGAVTHEAGATTTCQADFDSGLSQELLVRVDSLEGGAPVLDYAAQSGVLGSDAVERIGLEWAARQYTEVRQLTCPELEATQGARIECTATSDSGAELPVVAEMMYADVASGAFDVEFRARRG